LCVLRKFDLASNVCGNPNCRKRLLGLHPNTPQRARFCARC
jgi:hypothetical protein